MTMMVQKCSERVFSHRWDHPCMRTAVVTRDGKPYCKIHDPEYVKAKRAKLEAKWDEEAKVRDERYRRDRVIAAIVNNLPTDWLESHQGALRALYEAEAK